MPLKRKLTLISNSNTLIIQLLNALGFSVDETARNTPVKSKLPFKF